MGRSFVNSVAGLRGKERETGGELCGFDPSTEPPIRITGCDLKISGQFNIRRAFLFLSRPSCNKIAHGNRMAWMVLEFRHAKGSVMGNAEMDIVIEKCRPANSKFRTSDKRQLAPVLLV